VLELRGVFLLPFNLSPTLSVFAKWSPPSTKKVSTRSGMPVFFFRTVLFSLTFSLWCPNPPALARSPYFPAHNAEWLKPYCAIWDFHPQVFPPAGEMPLLTTLPFAIAFRRVFLPFLDRKRLLESGFPLLLRFHAPFSKTHQIAADPHNRIVSP